MKRTDSQSLPANYSVQRELQNKYCLYGSHAEVALLLSGRCMTLSNTNGMVFSPTTVIITEEKGEELRNEMKGFLPLLLRVRFYYHPEIFALDNGIDESRPGSSGACQRGFNC
ncbi:unnamed protein product [Larinioides sclopetarius]|uniref:Uncharacterized protein n=1 Tax=Larinioides sclopetarius TaxID=280406 RepID=A0AAV1ZM22_9ARAC